MLKHSIDVFAALGGFLLLAPVFLVVALLIRWNLGTSVLFHQVRPGLYGQPFEMIKFRPGITGLAQVNDIDMSTPRLLAETDQKMLGELTVAGKGTGDRVRS